MNYFKQCFHTEQNIDEYMAKFKGRSSMRQYLKTKPIKFWLKWWFQCASYEILKGNYCTLFFDNFLSAQHWSINLLKMKFNAIRAVSLFHMKITVSATKSLHKDCGPYNLHLTYFSSSAGKSKINVIAVFLRKLEQRPLLNYIYYVNNIVWGLVLI